MSKIFIDKYGRIMCLKNMKEEEHELPLYIIHYIKEQNETYMKKKNEFDERNFPKRFSWSGPPFLNYDSSPLNQFEFIYHKK